MARIAFLLGQEFEDSEMSEPYEAVRQKGHEAVIVGLKAGETLKGKQGKAGYTADKAIGDVKPEEFDAVIIPGGSSPENIRLDAGMKKFVTAMLQANKTVSAVCHGPQLLISAGLLKGRTITSVPVLQDDMRNAGATFVDKEVVVDGNLITSRTPQDLPAFIRETLHAVEVTNGVRS
ncbi:type 1 glutamine amidotransferase domain-containing protein [Paenibacillus sepulcri]